MDGVRRFRCFRVQGEADGDDVGPSLHGPGEAQERYVVGGVPVGARSEVILVLDGFLHCNLQNASGTTGSSFDVCL